MVSEKFAHNSYQCKSSSSQRKIRKSQKVRDISGTSDIYWSRFAPFCSTRTQGSAMYRVKKVSDTEGKSWREACVLIWYADKRYRYSRILVI